MRPDPHFDMPPLALRMPPDVPRPDNDDLKQAGSASSASVLGGVILLGGTLLALLALVLGIIAGVLAGGLR